jgi:hypothetical protein
MIMLDWELKFIAVYFYHCFAWICCNENGVYKRLYAANSKAVLT